MSEAPTIVSDNQVKTAKKVRIPPDKKFWHRYSPHHEFPWSAVISVAIYTLLGLLIFALVRLAIKDSDDAKPLPVGMVEPEGGGGHTEGVGTENPGDLDPKVAKEAIKQPDQEISPAPTPTEKLDSVVTEGVPLGDLLASDRVIEIDDNAKEALQKLRGVEEKARAQLVKGLTPPGKGRGGPGKGGGEGSGIGKEKGPGTGTGKARLDREARILRWKMQFNTRDGNDYLAQLRELGAIIAIPEPKGGYRVIRDLNPPASGEIEDLDSIKRIFWIDDKPDSVQSLAMSLRIPIPPPHFVAFFPESLEQELTQKEQKFRNRAEHQIRETRFRIVRRGGKYTPEVEFQR